MSDDCVLVLGATGTTGSRVVRLLDGLDGVRVKAASRRGPVHFDWRSPGTWYPALDDVTALYLMAPHERPVEPEFVRLAVRRGVRRIVLLSSRGVQEMDDRRLLEAEALVRDCGVPRWTIVRPDWFDQNFDEGIFRTAVLDGTLVLPLGGLRQGFVDAGDIAAVAARALTEDDHHGRVYELTGPQALSFGDAVAEICAATGRDIRYLGTEDDYRAANPDRDVEPEIAAWRAWGESTLTDTVRQVTGRDPVPFAEYVARAHRGGAWA